jgi:regulator of protease activity HflC (stomatin/prohibitin superfamily)
MSRHTLLCLALAAAPLAVACDKSGTDAQAEVNAAQNKANAQIAQANEQVTTTGALAQAEADKKIIAAQADFAKTREDYRHTVQSNLDDLSKRLADLDVKAKASTSPDLRATVTALRAQENAFIVDYQSLASTSPEAWDATKARLDKEWSALKATADKVD